MRLLRSPSFWFPFAATLIAAGIFFAWELNMLPGLPSLPRPPLNQSEWIFTALLGLLLALNAGLAVWRSREDSCPIGVKSASGLAGVIGAITLICPACVLLPASLIGIGFFFGAIAPFLPLLRIVAIVLLLVSTTMLWPKR